MNPLTRSTVSRTVKRTLDLTKSLDGQPEHLTWEGYVFAITIGLCMAFTAGYANGVCLSGFLHVGDPYVTHPVAGVTNLFTESAISLLTNNMTKYSFQVGTIMSTMVGSCISAILNPRPVPFILSPRYGPTFIIGSIFSTLGALAAVGNGRREFHFTSVGCGIMNGVTSMYSANLIRVSSFSGPVTDIGLYIGQWIRGNRSNNWRLYTLSGLTLFFFIGGLVGYEVAIAQRNLALIFNAVFFFFIGITVILYFVIRMKMNIFEALLGIGKVGIRFEHISVKYHKTDSQGNDVEKSVGHEDLSAIYDELLEREGQVNEDALMTLLASRDLEVKRHRRSILGIIQEKFHEHDGEGDWTISREDWEKLVAKSIHKSLGDSTTKSGSVNDSIRALQKASISQIQSTGWSAYNTSEEVAEEIPKEDG